jgi:hypothetical protein
MQLWNGYATAITGSQEYVGWEGLQYELALAQMASNPNMTADQVAVAFSQSASADKTWAALAVDGRYITLKNAVNDLAVALNTGLAANRTKINRAFGATRSFWQAPMDKDLYDMAFELNRNVTDANIKAKSVAVMNAMTGVNGVVLHQYHTNAYADTYGITIYHISKASEKNADYIYYRANVDFALETLWDEFLNNYAQ